MDFKRLWFTLRLCLIRNGYKRAEFAKRKGIYNGIGEKVMIQPRKIPLYPQLIRYHNNIQVASNVTYLTHDVTHNVLNAMDADRETFEKIGCIEIMDNVFIGSNSTILYNVRIGPNAIVAAGSVVTKDVPENTVVGGNPAKVIGTFDNYIKKRLMNTKVYPEELKPIHQKMKPELALLEWEEFDKKYGMRSREEKTVFL